jgi:putative Mg2+ transporter-C (MgtC) family protein
MDPFQEFSDLALGMRLLLATIAGIALGWPDRHRPGGIRTHVLVTLGAALFCITAVRLTSEADALLRVVQGIASGIGFVGAAAVLKRGGAIVGISTAASIWISAAIGCEIGLGSPEFAVAVAIAVAALNAGVRWLEHTFVRRRRRRGPTPTGGP